MLPSVRAALPLSARVMVLAVCVGVRSWAAWCVPVFANPGGERAAPSPSSAPPPPQRRRARRTTAHEPSHCAASLCDHRERGSSA